MATVTVIYNDILISVEKATYEKVEYKSMGGKWNNDQRKCYIFEYMNAKDFEKWINLKWKYMNGKD